MTAPAPDKLITAEEFLDVEDDGHSYELVDGILRERIVSKNSSRVATWISWLLLNFVNPQRLGAVFDSELGIRIFSGHPNLVRRADVSFVAVGRESSADSGFLEIPPDLVVEVVSPGNRAAELADKVTAWLDAGVTMVWVAFPSTRQLQVYRRGVPGVILAPSDVLSGEDVLPGFSISVGDLFPSP